MRFLAELWTFLLARRKLWLLPIILIAVMLSGMMMLAQGSAIAPFIYALF